MSTWQRRQGDAHFRQHAGETGLMASMRQPRDPKAGAGDQVSATWTDLDVVIGTHLFLWLPCFYGETGFPFTILIIISPFKIQVSGNGESARGKTGK